MRTWELLIGKALAGTVPALFITWISAGLFLLAVGWFGWGNLIASVLTPSWFLSLFLVTPAVALLSFALGVIASSRARDARSAHGMAVVIILPVFALIGIQISGIVWFTPLLTLTVGIVVSIIDIVGLRAAASLFQRESILVKWH